MGDNLMKLEDQVVNLELSKRLKELCVKQESLFYWAKYNDYFQEEFNLVIFDENDFITIDFEYVKNIGCSCCQGSYEVTEQYSAFTVAELGEMLPDKIVVDDINVYLNVHKNSFEKMWNFHYPYIIDISSSNEANARAKMLIWLIENGHIK